MADALLIRCLSLTIRHRAILTDLTMKVSAGEKVAIVGPNGAGKSSLLRTIAGLQRNFGGVVEVGGALLRGISPRRLSTVVSFVPQRLMGLPRVTVADFLDISGARYLDAGMLARIEHLFSRYLPDLSGGELQRVLLAGAASQGGKLLLLDEPTAHLDPAGRSEVVEMIVEYGKESAVTCLLVTHDISLAIQTADRIVVMRGGKIVWDGASSDPTLVSVLMQAYGCGFVELFDPQTRARVVVPG